MICQSFLESSKSSKQLIWFKNKNIIDFKFIHSQYAHDVVLTSIRHRFKVMDVVWTSKGRRMLTGFSYKSFDVYFHAMLWFRYTLYHNLMISHYQILHLYNFSQRKETHKHHYYITSKQYYKALFHYFKSINFLTFCCYDVTNYDVILDNSSSRNCYYNNSFKS